MTRALPPLLLLAFAGGACCHQPEPRPPAAAATGSPGSAVAAAASPDASSDVAGKLDARLHPSGQLPAQVGTSTSSIEGCLTAAGEEAGRQHPAPATTRSGAEPVELQPAPGGLVVVHQLAHACCLRGAVASRVEGDAVTVTETLSGNPCRCMCGSTLRTAVRLAPGRYRVAVVLAHDEAQAQGTTERVLERTVEVR